MADVYFEFRGQTPFKEVMLALFPVLSAAIGLGLTLATYRRWVRSDVV